MSGPTHDSQLCLQTSFIVLKCINLHEDQLIISLFLQSIHLPPLSRGSRPYHPGSGRSSSFSLSQPSYTPTHSRPVPITTANFDNSSIGSSRVGGGVLRGEHYPASHYPPSHPLNPRVPQHTLVNDPDYSNTYGGGFLEHKRNYTPDSFGSHHQHPKAQSPFQRGRPYRSSLDNYQREELYRLPQSRGDRVSSIGSSRETSFNGRHFSSSSITGEPNSHRYPPPSRKLTPDSNYSRKIPFHLTAAGRRQSAPSFDRRGMNLDSVRRVSERASALPKAIQVPVEVEMPPRGRPVGTSSLNDSSVQRNIPVSIIYCIIAHYYYCHYMLK